MDKIAPCVEVIRAAFGRCRGKGLTETQTRTIFINPMLESLGWDVKDPDLVQEEFPTLGGKTVDYALKTDLKPAVFVEAKALNDPLDEKAITHVIGYAANAGVEWCVLTNGMKYKVYRSTISKPAHEKLVYEVDLHPDSPNAISLEVAASQLSPLSRESVENGTLAETVGSECVKKALDGLFANPAGSLINLLHSHVVDLGVTKGQVRKDLSNLRQPSAPLARPTQLGAESVPKSKGDNEEQNLLDLLAALDESCREFGSGDARRREARYQITYYHRATGRSFCVITDHSKWKTVPPGGLLVALHLQDPDVKEDVSHLRTPIRGMLVLGHFIGFFLNSLQQVEVLKPYIQIAFERAKRYEKGGIRVEIEEERKRRSAQRTGHHPCDRS